MIDCETVAEIDAGLYWCDLHWCGPEFPNWYADSDGAVYRDGLDVTPSRDRRGYLRVPAQGRPEAVHTLVCTAFHGPRPKPTNTPRGHRGLGVAHYNDVPDDNRPENLRWATIRENIVDAQRNGRFPRARERQRVPIAARPLTSHMLAVLAAAAAHPTGAVVTGSRQTWTALHDRGLIEGGWYSGYTVPFIRITAAAYRALDATTD